MSDPESTPDRDGDLIRLTTECLRLRDAILDIDAHATPLGEDADGFVTGGYTITVGSLHRALGVIGHTAVKCRDCTEDSHDCSTVNRLWSVMQRACNHPERWNEILSEALDSLRPGAGPNRTEVTRDDS